MRIPFWQPRAMVQTSVQSKWHGLVLKLPFLSMESCIANCYISHLRIPDSTSYSKRQTNRLNMHLQMHPHDDPCSRFNCRLHRCQPRVVSFTQPFDSLLPMAANCYCFPHRKLVSDFFLLSLLSYVPCLVVFTQPCDHLSCHSELRFRKVNFSPSTFPFLTQTFSSL